MSRLLFTFFLLCTIQPVSSQYISQQALISDFIQKQGISAISMAAHPTCTAQSFSCNFLYESSWRLIINYNEQDGSHFSCSYLFKITNGYFSDFKLEKCGNNSYKCFEGCNNAKNFGLILSDLYNQNNANSNQNDTWSQRIQDFFTEKVKDKARELSCEDYLYGYLAIQWSDDNNQNKIQLNQNSITNNSIVSAPKIYGGVEYDIFGTVQQELHPFESWNVDPKNPNAQTTYYVLRLSQKLLFQDTSSTMPEIKNRKVLIDKIELTDLFHDFGQFLNKDVTIRCHLTGNAFTPYFFATSYLVKNISLGNSVGNNSLSQKSEQYRNSDSKIGYYKINGSLSSPVPVYKESKIEVGTVYFINDPVKVWISEFENNMGYVTYTDISGIRYKGWIPMFFTTYIGIN